MGSFEGVGGLIYKIFIVLLLSSSLTSFISCSGDPKGVDVNKSRDSSSANLDLLKRDPVDASKLSLTNVSVGKLIQNKEVVARISFDTHGSADYVEYSACGSGERCFTGKSAVTRIILPPFKMGPVEIKLRSCVDE
jgi:hypothetical protein